MATFICRQCLARPSFRLNTPTRPLSSSVLSRLSYIGPVSARVEHRTERIHATQKRSFQHLAQQQQPPKAEPPSSQPAPPTPAKQDLGGDAVHVSQAEQRRRDWSIVRQLAVNLWPKDDYKTRARVVFGFGLLVGGKVCTWSFESEIACIYAPSQLLNVQVPLFFKQIIDTLNLDIAAGSTVGVVVGSVILGCEFPSHFRFSLMLRHPPSMKTVQRVLVRHYPVSS